MVRTRVGISEGIVCGRPQVSAQLHVDKLTTTHLISVLCVLLLATAALTVQLLRALAVLLQR